MTTIKVASDNGNSSIKMVLEGELFKQPSIISPIYAQPNPEESDLMKAQVNLMDNMLVRISSPSIKQNGLFIIGNKVHETNGTVRNMNIKVGEKHTDDIPLIMSLGMIASKIVQNSIGEVGEDEKIQNEISVDVKYSGALPAGEYTPQIARELEKRLLNNHVVDVYVAEQVVIVRLNVVACKITQEGNPVTFFVAENENIFDEYKEKYNEVISKADLLKKNYLHVDIGDGTTEFIYVERGRVISTLCTGERLGVGHAADEAIKLFKQMTNSPIKLNRQQFMKIVQDKYHHLQNEAIQALEQAQMVQSTLILEKVQELYLNDLSGNVDIITVSGGGAIVFEGTLKHNLIHWADQVRNKVLWIPQNDINVKGLHILNEKIFFKE